MYTLLGPRADNRKENSSFIALNINISYTLPIRLSAFIEILKTPFKLFELLNHCHIVFSIMQLKNKNDLYAIIRNNQEAEELFLNKRYSIFWKFSRNKSPKKIKITPVIYLNYIKLLSEWQAKMIIYNLFLNILQGGYTTNEIYGYIIHTNNKN